MGNEFKVHEHILVPKHAKLSAKEKKILFEQYSIQSKDLPRILITDPAISHLGIEDGDIIKISRKSSTSGTSTFYRRVANE